MHYFVVDASMNVIHQFDHPGEAEEFVCDCGHADWYVLPLMPVS